MEIQEKINDYWSKRADEFSECRLKDLDGFQRKIWTDIISKAEVNDTNGGKRKFGSDSNMFMIYGIKVR